MRVSAVPPRSRQNNVWRAPVMMASMLAKSLCMAADSACWLMACAYGKGLVLPLVTSTCYAAIDHCWAKTVCQQ
jgi:hypothetical protein